jgi:cysteine desulfurase family protein
MNPIYLDQAATSWPKPDAVIAAWVEYHKTVSGSPGRGSHRGSVEGSRRVERVRRELCGLLGGTDPSRVLFQPSCTHAINLAIAGLLKPGDHALATAVDHNAVLRPLAALEAAGTIEFTIVDADPSGRVDPAAVRAAMRPHTRLVVCTHASNALGTIQDVEGIAAVAHEKGARFLLDAAQTAGVLPIDMARSAFDMVAVPSHKSLLGPSGSGALLVAAGVDLRPLWLGGTGFESQQLLPEPTWPGGFEAGTGNPAGIAAWGEGIQTVADAGILNIMSRERELTARLIEGLARISNITIFGGVDAATRVGTVALAVEGMDSHEVAAILDAHFGILVRAGHVCAARLHRVIGGPPEGWVRVSIGYSNTAGDIDAAVAALAEIARSVTVY